MRTRLYWRKSEINQNEDSFWIECTESEVSELILPLRSDENFIRQIELNKGFSKLSDNERKYEYFFLISTDLTQLKSFPWYYPYSGLWNGYNPFKSLNQVYKLKNLSELSEILTNCK